MSLELWLTLLALAFVGGMITGVILARNCDKKKREGKW